MKSTPTGREAVRRVVIHGQEGNSGGEAPRREASVDFDLRVREPVGRGDGRKEGCWRRLGEGERGPVTDIGICGHSEPPLRVGARRASQAARRRPPCASSCCRAGRLLRRRRSPPPQLAVRRAPAAAGRRCCRRPPPAPPPAASPSLSLFCRAARAPPAEAASARQRKKPGRRKKKKRKEKRRKEKEEKKRKEEKRGKKLEILEFRRIRRQTFEGEFSVVPLLGGRDFALDSSLLVKGMFSC
ncbi:uncharacterized protein LOC133897062 [Phragmites australis]|uniref:uncharacterized protein LOC133897062 n=1 Tax=Phragmites australis TaxID=29695 RepID=UPI002D780227|nr:uncharacterized protein LOC133897062 [Phragmites australis]